MEKRSRGGKGRKKGKGGASGSGGSGGPGKGFYLALAAVAAGGIAFLVFAGGDGGGDGPGLDAPLPAWASSVEADSASGIGLGPADAPVTVWEFADHQCPHCAQFGTFVGRLLRENYVRGEGIVRWVQYDYLIGFPNSLSSALAARCAGRQDAYWGMHEKLLATQTEWGNEGNPARLYRGYADELGLDVDAFATCLSEREPLEPVLASHAFGKSVGVGGTPTLFVNGRKVESTTYEALETRILEAAEAAADGGDSAEAAGSAGTAPAPGGVSAEDVVAAAGGSRPR